MGSAGATLYLYDCELIGPEWRWGGAWTPVILAFAGMTARAGVPGGSGST